MFKGIKQWLMTSLFASWARPWDDTLEMEFQEWAYRRGLNIKTDVKN